jgi:hypothetical protein
LDGGREDGGVGEWVAHKCGSALCGWWGEWCSVHSHWYR